MEILPEGTSEHISDPRQMNYCHHYLKVLHPISPFVGRPIPANQSLKFTITKSSSASMFTELAQFQVYLEKTTYSITPRKCYLISVGQSDTSFMHKCTLRPTKYNELTRTNAIKMLFKIIFF